MEANNEFFKNFKGFHHVFDTLDEFRRSLFAEFLDQRAEIMASNAASREEFFEHYVVKGEAIRVDELVHGSRRDLELPPSSLGGAAAGGVLALGLGGAAGASNPAGAVKALDSQARDDKVLNIRDRIRLMKKEKERLEAVSKASFNNNTNDNTNDNINVIKTQSEHKVEEQVKNIVPEIVSNPPLELKVSNDNVKEIKAVESIKKNVIESRNELPKPNPSSTVKLSTSQKSEEKENLPTSNTSTVLVSGLKDKGEPDNGRSRKYNFFNAQTIRETISKQNEKPMESKPKEVPPSIKPLPSNEKVKVAVENKTSIPVVSPPEMEEEDPLLNTASSSQTQMDSDIKLFTDSPAEHRMDKINYFTSPVKEIRTALDYGNSKSSSLKQTISNDHFAKSLEIFSPIRREGSTDASSGLADDVEEEVFLKSTAQTSSIPAPSASIPKPLDREQSKIPSLSASTNKPVSTVPPPAKETRVKIMPSPPRIMTSLKKNNVPPVGSQLKQMFTIGEDNERVAQSLKTSAALQMKKPGNVIPSKRLFQETAAIPHVSVVQKPTNTSNTYNPKANEAPAPSNNKPAVSPSFSSDSEDYSSEEDDNIVIKDNVIRPITEVTQTGTPAILYDKRKNKRSIPDWAKTPVLKKVLQSQSEVAAESIFKFGDKVRINLHEVFTEGRSSSSMNPSISTSSSTAVSSSSTATTTTSNKLYEKK